MTRSEIRAVRIDGPGVAMEIVELGPAGPNVEPIVQDFRRRHAPFEDTVLESLLGALATRQAQGLVALVQGRPAGMVVLSQRGEGGRIHFLHALGGQVEVLEALVVRAEDVLRAAGSTHLAATLALVAGDPVESVLLRQRWRGFLRARMRLDLGKLPFGPRLPAGYTIVPWQEDRREEAAALIEEASRDTDDAALYPEFSDLAGATSLVERAVAGEFGPFEAGLAPMALAGDTLAGLCLATWHEAFAGQGFILDLAVAPAHRRRGLGRGLVATTAQAFRRAGATTLGLAVTLSNRPAVQLYEGLGFQIELLFGVFHKALRMERK